MAQTFTLDRHTDPSNPTAVPANNEKIKNYETIADMEGDLTNVDDGEVISTEEADYASVHISNGVTDGDLNPVTSNAVYDAIEAAKIDIYKPNVEERTGRIWVDGKPIYRRYFNVTVPWTQAQTEWYGSLEDTSVSYETLIHYEGTWGYNWTGIGYQPYLFGSTIPTPNTYGSGGEILTSCVRLTDHTLQCYCYIGDQRHAVLSSDCIIKLVVYYTKSTDSAIDPLPDSGGGISTTSENIAGIIVNDGIHYSTIETLTGDVWVNGKPIYRKVFVDTIGVTAGTSRSLSTGLPSGSVDDVITLKTTFKDTDSRTYWWGTDYAYMATSPAASLLTVNVYLNNNGTSLEINNLGNWPATSRMIIVLEYTKN